MAWPIAGLIPASGLAGSFLAVYLSASLNLTGASLATAACWIVSLYLVSRFEMAHVFRLFRRPVAWVRSMVRWFDEWRQERVRRAREKAKQRAARRALEAKREVPAEAVAIESPAGVNSPPIFDPHAPAAFAAAAGAVRSPRSGPASPAAPMAIEDIPIRMLEPAPSDPDAPPFEPDRRMSHAAEPLRPRRTIFKIPPTDLLQEPPARSPFDSQELYEIAARIKAKFEEFSVMGSVVQINPGPVVTTFEFKPDSGVKYSRITALVEDLCLGLQAESILIERIPGQKAHRRYRSAQFQAREVISLRQILESRKSSWDRLRR